MLGRDLQARLRRAGWPVIALTRLDLDVTDLAAVRDALARVRPDVVVNCAAWTAVDAAEEHEAEALAVNGAGPANLAAACSSGGIRLVQPSTDYVFDGAARQPYPENAVPAPRNAYGRTKLAGEQAVLDHLPESGYVLRTAWLYGAHGPNFVRTMIRLERLRPSVDVVDDQQGQPTWTVDVADQIIALIRRGAPPGIYHATNTGQTTWCGLAREIFRMLGADPARVQAVSSRVMDRPAPRPSYSVLGHDQWERAGIAPLGDWQAALRRAFPALLAAEVAHRGEAESSAPPQDRRGGSPQRDSPQA